MILNFKTISSYIFFFGTAWVLASVIVYLAILFVWLVTWSVWVTTSTNLWAVQFDFVYLILLSLLVGLGLVGLDFKELCEECKLYVNDTNFNNANLNPIQNVESLVNRQNVTICNRNHHSACTLVRPIWYKTNQQSKEMVQYLDAYLLKDLREIVLDYVSDYICIHTGLCMGIPNSMGDWSLGYKSAWIKQVICNKTSTEIRFRGWKNRHTTYDIDKRFFAENFLDEHYLWI